MPASDSNLYIDKIKLPDNSIHLIRDTSAHEKISSLSNYSEFLGIVSTDTPLEDGSTARVIIINNKGSVTASTGAIVIQDQQEFIFNGTSWSLFGDLSAAGPLGQLAYTSTARGSFIPEGIIETQTGTISFNGNCTPEGEINLQFSSSEMPINIISNISDISETVNYCEYIPTGFITSTINHTVETASVLTSVIGNELVSNIEVEVLSSSPTINYTTVTGHNLILHSLLPRVTNTINSITSIPVISSISASITSVFQGDQIYITPISITIPVSATFSGTTSNITVTGTIINDITFTGTAGTIVVSAVMP